jgi:hypothetical protein
MMKRPSSKQPALKPQDLLVALKMCVNSERLNYSNLAQQLFMSPSEVHAAVQRGRVMHLLTQNQETYEPNRASLREFLLYGIKYVFPIVLGGLTRGIPTGVSARPLNQHFEQSDALPLVWPDDEGHLRGISTLPIYPSVPAACKKDEKLYRLLSVVDALRGGAARERELAKSHIDSVLR